MQIITPIISIKDGIKSQLLYIFQQNLTNIRQLQKLGTRQEGYRYRQLKFSPCIDIRLKISSTKTEILSINIKCVLQEATRYMYIRYNQRHDKYLLQITDILNIRLLESYHWNHMQLSSLETPLYNFHPHSYRDEYVCYDMNQKRKS